jgi:hypothetical protein
MRTPDACSLMLTACAACGCAFDRPEPVVPRSRENPQFAVVLDKGCARADPVIEARASGLHALAGSEGWYARREMAEAAKERDELVMRLIAREAAVDRCELRWEGSQRKLVWGLLITALVTGHDPAHWEYEITAIDKHLRPTWMPLSRRACAGDKLEDAGLCISMGPFAVLADVVTLPIGGWFWTPKPVTTSVSLAEFPPAPSVMAAAERALALGRQAREAGVVVPELR